MIASGDVIAFAPHTDPDRACAFYRDVLGLALVERNAFASVFDANGTMLRVTTVQRVDPRPYTVLGLDGRRPRGRLWASSPAQASSRSATTAWSRTPPAYGPPPGRPDRLVPRPRRQHPVADAALLNWRGTPAARRSRSASPAQMALRTLLSPLSDDPDTAALARDGGRAFVAAALRPYLIAALRRGRARRPRPRRRRRRPRRPRPRRRPARLARAPARALLPSRGVSYESHWRRRHTSSGCASPRSTRCGEEEAPVVVVSAVALSEKVPDPELRPHGFAIEKGELLDLEETARSSWPRATSASTRSTTAASSPSAAGSSTSIPATEERAVRVDLFDDEVESLRRFSTFTQRSLGEADAGRDRARGRARARAPRAGRDRRARGGRRAPRRRRAAAGRSLPRLPRPRARRARRRRSPPRRTSARAGRPLAGRHAPPSTTPTPTTST